MSRLLKACHSVNGVALSGAPAPEASPGEMAACPGGRQAQGGPWEGVPGKGSEWVSFLVP